MSRCWLLYALLYLPLHPALASSTLVPRPSTPSHRPSRLGPSTLLGYATTECGGRIAVYMATAHPGPLDAAGVFEAAHADAVLAHIFPFAVAFLRSCLNRIEHGSLGAAAVAHLNAGGAPTLLHGPEHRGTEPQAQSALGSGALYALDRALHDEDWQRRFFADEVCRRGECTICVR